MTTFGPGDATPNDCAWSGANSFWTNWNTSTWATGVLGRITALAMRWDGSNNAPCLTCTGRNDLWNTSNNLVLNTGTYSVVCTAICNGGVGAGTLHSASTSDLWQNNASYYLGIWRPASQCTHLAWVNSAHGGYAGKSADDSTNTGGTANWGGTTNGGLLGYGTITDTNIYVRRAGAWTKTFVYVRRAGAWSTNPVFVYVRRSGSWTLLNQLGTKEFEIGPNGIEGMAEFADGTKERVLLVEEGQKSWFGSGDPTNQDFDWRQEGHFIWHDNRPWSGKYNSHESEEVAHERLNAAYEWDKALRLENYQEANKWWKKFQPPLPTITPQVPIIEKPEEERRILVPAHKVERPVFDDPEPVMLGCGCA